MSIIDNVNEEDCDTSTSSAEIMFKHAATEDHHLTEEELDLCEDEISVRSFSSHSSGSKENNTHMTSHAVLPKSRIVPREPLSIPLKVYAR